jgi:hypothetical protein
MKTGRTPAEVVQIREMFLKNRTFNKVFGDDWTGKVMEELRYRIYGKIPRNFLINITGLIGTPTGIFKSTLGLQIALALDPLFTLQQRVAFSINQLLDKVRMYSEYNLCNRCYVLFTKTYQGTYEVYQDDSKVKCNNCDNVTDRLVLLTKMIFFLDEQTKTLKTGGITRLQNLVDTCRQRQICFITCGVQQYGMSFTTYNLKRIQESHDDYLPEKKVRFAVYDDERDIFYGYFQWDITPLTDPFWKRFWDEYSKMKTDFQRVAIAQQTQAQNFEEYAQEIIDSEDFLKCFKITREGKKIMQGGLVRNLVFKRFPDLTQNERDMIYNEIRMIIYEDED